MEDHKKVPVLVSVYNRLYTLKRCIEALRANPEAVDTDLFIVSDAPGRACDVERVKQVRDYVATISGFKSIILIARPENWGSDKSIWSAIDNLLTKHDRLIFMEDDILPSPHYLAYMNRGLAVYQDNPNVFAICGYKSNFKLPSNYVSDLIALNRYSPWGIGLWKEKFDKAGSKIHRDRYNELRTQYPDVFTFMQKHDPQFIGILKGDSEGCLNAADVRIEYYLLLSKQVCIYPRQSMTKVMESGNDAEHSSTRWRESEEFGSACPADFGMIELRMDPDIYHRFLAAKYPSVFDRFIFAVKHYGVKWSIRYYWGRIKLRFVRKSSIN